MLNNNFGYSHAIKEYSQLNNMTDFSNFESSKKTFKFIHNTFTHKSWMINNNCQIVNKNFKEYQGLFNVGYCSMKLLNNFFVKLKSLDIYDETKIIIVSDHGVYGRDIEVNTKKFSILEPGASALMLVKDFNQSGDLKTSIQFMSNMDTYGIALSGVSEGAEVKLDKIKTPEENRSLIFIKEVEPIVSYNITKAFRVKDNIFDEKNWQELSEEEIKFFSTE